MTPEQLAIKNVGKQVDFCLYLLETLLKPGNSQKGSENLDPVVYIFHLFKTFLLFNLQDPKRHLEEHVDVLMTSNIVQCLAAMLDTVVFQ